MKYAKLPLILLCAALVTGCIFEDMDECYNTIRFSYTGDNGDEALFAEKIKKLDLYVFDEDERHVLTHTLTQAELASRSARVMLPPGKTYHAVAIGNANEYDPHLLDGGEIDNVKLHHHVTHPEIETGDRRMESQDHLYHGSMMDIDIPKGGNLTTEPIKMNASHFDMMVNVRGYAGLPTRQEGVEITLEHTDLPSWLDFDNKHSKHDSILNQDFISHHPEGVTTDDGYSFVYNVLRHTPTFDDDSNIIIRDANGEEIYSMSSAQFIADNADKIDLTLQEVFVVIDIEFTNIGVVVSIPEWAVIDTEPEF